MNDDPGLSIQERWARLRFAIVGPLLAAPPPAGQLQTALAELASKSWRHPITGAPIQFGYSTLERWFYRARNAPQDPVGALRPQRRNDAGQPRRLSGALVQALASQYRAHPGWSYQLHYENLAVVVAEDPQLAPLPSYATLRRYMKAHGLFKQRRRTQRRSPGQEVAEQRLQQREVRSFEAEYTHALWHADFHHGSRAVVTAEGRWVTPLLLGVMDDYSRLICHVQWYLDESAETLVHGLCQAFQKRALPRALMTDRGGAMLAEEVTEGLQRLGIVHEPTLPYSPYQNAKQEVFWASVEGRLLAMLEGVEELTLERLNEATQAWTALDYQRKRHSELGCAPLQRALEGPQVGRDSPDSESLRCAFRMELTRTQRRSDGTITVYGRRFELPSRYRHLQRVRVRVARWDLRRVDLVDGATQTVLCALYPLDKSAHGQAQRRRLEPLAEPPPAQANASTETRTSAPANASGEMAPLLKQLIAEYAATGLPPAYLPKTPETDS